ncbi:MAG: hypothetical protein K2K25_04250 [Muribaculaceae bacterium]|nr:hypothetical protein [Muribaculaceae bacterium]
MGEKDYLKLATDFSIKNWNFDIVKPAREARVVLFQLHKKRTTKMEQPAMRLKD